MVTILRAAETICGKETYDGHIDITPTITIATGLAFGAPMPKFCEAALNLAVRPRCGRAAAAAPMACGQER